MNDEHDTPSLFAAWAILEDSAIEGGARAPASRRVYSELQALAAKMQIAPRAREEIVQRVFLKVDRALRSPTRRRGQTKSEAGVRAYLRKALKSALSDRRAAGVRDEELAEGKARAQADGSAEGASALGELVEALIERVVEPLAHRKRADRALSLPRELREMVDLRLGRTSVPELVGGSPADPGYKRRRAAMYTRHKRTRQALLNEVDRRARLGTLSEDEAAAFQRLIDALRRRRPVAKERKR